MDGVEFGRYRLLSLIGEGGMGKVYKAHDTMMDRDVAIKVLPPELASEPNYERRFRREAHIAARLNEPHIIPIHEAGEIDGRLYLVMPIVEGTDVHELLQRDGPMSPARAVHIIEQLAAALDAAHAAGLVHRDIKPQNTLVTSRDFAYLIDFGIARDGSGSKLTGTDRIIGTMACMAPERFNSGVADARSDVYALACMLHECLTGELPFPGDSMEQQITAHLMLDPPRPSHIRADVPNGFDDVIATGMAKNPDERYQSAHALATAARRALTAAPVAAPTRRHDLPAPGARDDGPTRILPGTPRAVRQPVGRPVPAAMQQRAPGWGPPQPPPQPQPPPNWSHPAPIRPAPTRRRGPLIAGIVVAVVILTVGALTVTLLTRSDSGASRTATATTAKSALPSETTVAPISEDALQGLLLTSDQVSAAFGAPAMTLTSTVNTLPGNGTASVSDQACVPLAAAASSAVYADSGWTAVRGQEFKYPASGPPVHDVVQFAVLFTSARDAVAFFAASAQRWEGCSDRQFTVSAPGSGFPDTVEKVGPVANNNGTLSATLTNAANSAINCQRAFTVANNVAVDVQACNSSPTSDAVAVSVAHQIANKVRKTM
ncbi:serine/threonine-protein kinase PknH/PknJ [Mycobacterium bourgelatii]|uniref:serine/threonine-protein kinase PknH/PknJ n=1 Tax=Mycobacterium bourgelatii TaxID=1273442 RepID=UPI0013D87823|nr:serine/threonine-protein kinase PknH/PknJ [Mycobacterium bourgelatii]MCV6975777.1 sensor domain-containing protein [Mycobacterium bourgelatii]